MYNILRRGLTRVAYPGQGNARARAWDKRTVETPTSFAFIYTATFQNRRLRVSIGINNKYNLWFILLFVQTVEMQIMQCP